MGSQYENEMAKEMHRETSDVVRTVRCGYSGSNAMAQPDVLVTAPDMNHGLELKGPIQNPPCAVTEEDLEQLIEFGNGYTAVYLVVKFPHREPLVVRYYENLSWSEDDWDEEWDDMSVAEQFETLIPPAFNPRVNVSDKTDTTRLYLDKPDTDGWPSTRSGRSDEVAVLEEIGVVGGVTV